MVERTGKAPDQPETAPRLAAGAPDGPGMRTAWDDQAKGEMLK